MTYGLLAQLVACGHKVPCAFVACAVLRDHRGRPGWPSRRRRPRFGARRLRVALAVAATTWIGQGNKPTATSIAGSTKLVRSGSDLVAKAEAARLVSRSRTRDVSLTAAPAAINLADRAVDTWASNGQVPGPTIRAQVGDVIRARVKNEPPKPLTVHWHGVAIRDDMDGVPGLTQKAIASGSGFVYRFTVSSPGRYFYHPHTGVQLDRGLYGALVIAEPLGRHPARYPLLLDDWTMAPAKLRMSSSPA